MTKHTAHIEIVCKNPKFIIESIKPDDTEASRFSAKMSHTKNKFILDIEAEDASALTAGINSYLRLVRSVEKL